MVCLSTASLLLLLWNGTTAISAAGLAAAWRTSLPLRSGSSSSRRLVVWDGNDETGYKADTTAAAAAVLQLVVRKPPPGEAHHDFGGAWAVRQIALKDLLLQQVSPSLSANEEDCNNKNLVLTKLKERVVELLRSHGHQEIPPLVFMCRENKEGGQSLSLVSDDDFALAFSAEAPPTQIEVEWLRDRTTTTTMTTKSSVGERRVPVLFSIVSLLVPAVAALVCAYHYPTIPGERRSYHDEPSRLVSWLNDAVGTLLPAMTLLIFSGSFGFLLVGVAVFLWEGPAGVEKRFFVEPRHW